MLELALGKYVEAAIIAGLLVFNAALGLFQESRAQATLAALKSRLALNASVRRDGAWKTDTRRRAGAGRRGEAFARRRGRRGCAPHRRRNPARPIHAHRRIRAHRSRRRRADLCRGAGPARRGGGGGHGDRRAHQVRPHRRTRPHRPCRKLPAEGGAARGAQSRRVQRRRHRAAGRLCLLSQDAARRDHPPRADGGARIDPGRAAGHLHPCVGARRAGAGKAGRSADAPLRGG